MLSAGDGDGGAAVFSVPVSSVLPEKDSVFVEFGRVPSTLDVGGAGDACLRRRLGAYSPSLLLISLDSGVESSSLLGAAANSGVSANASSMDSLLGKSGGMSDGRALL